ncbi:hypothetical protein MBM_04039 [Drepanopeziza brunnea f. sp. 'multigermtubi' MB_m1]|uniref:Cytochrome c oxidase assembly protein COX20, mitochondrial n=1 Tax=Marssonina brunnea f. sp. multigermtubi (strain MB_m1) TaxID=1072389 RepID=K1WJ70_MARBU|nr:uncharacterized protein MBM_04039 [Drepanopeziza brunnea f. sp. 'multigermtubi' MB_m1]EKD17670.1 hypothetical protein MBM_04039 [Drepanopeziza brunnea f. sp. 'multigermtubi' MB_m1]
MAGDTRETHPTPTPRGPPPESSEGPNKVYEVFNTPPASANALPEGSGQNTAGRHEQAPTLTSALKTVRLGDFKQVHMYPCVRESLLMGIGGAFGVGGVRAVWGGERQRGDLQRGVSARWLMTCGITAPLPKACNWAVGTFVFTSWANYEFCLYRRSLERAHMKRAVEIIDRKKAEKEMAAKAKREERRRLKEEADRRAEEAAKARWWKFW